MPNTGLVLTEWLLDLGCSQHPVIKSGWRTEVFRNLQDFYRDCQNKTKYEILLNHCWSRHLSLCLFTGLPLPPPYAKNTKNKESLLLSPEFCWGRQKSLETIGGRLSRSRESRVCLFWAVGRAYGLHCATPFSCSDSGQVFSCLRLNHHINEILVKLKFSEGPLVHLFGTDDRAAEKASSWRENKAQCADQTHFLEQSTASLESGLKMWKLPFLLQPSDYCLLLIFFPAR